MSKPIIELKLEAVRCRVKTPERTLFIIKCLEGKHKDSWFVVPERWIEDWESKDYPFDQVIKFISPEEALFSIEKELNESIQAYLR